MNKKIIFILDSFELYKWAYSLNNSDIFCNSTIDTQTALDYNMPIIWTYDISHIGFYLNDLGYNIVIGYNGRLHCIYEHMPLPSGKDLRKGHNLLKILIGHGFNDLLGIEPKRYIPTINSVWADVWEETQLKQTNRDNLMYDYVNGFTDNNLNYPYETYKIN